MIDAARFGCRNMCFIVRSRPSNAAAQIIWPRYGSDEVAATVLELSTPDGYANAVTVARRCGTACAACRGSRRAQFDFLACSRSRRCAWRRSARARCRGRVGRRGRQVAQAVEAVDDHDEARERHDERELHVAARVIGDQPWISGTTAPPTMLITRIEPPYSVSLPVSSIVRLQIVGQHGPRNTSRPRPHRRP